MGARTQDHSAKGQAHDDRVVRGASFVNQASITRSASRSEGILRSATTGFASFVSWISSVVIRYPPTPAHVFVVP